MRSNILFPAYVRNGTGSGEDYAESERCHASRGTCGSGKEQ